MEAQPPHSIVSRTVQPTRSAFPPDGLVSVAPHTPHEMMVVEREKMMDSFPQSLQETFINWPTIVFTSSIHEFKLLGSLARRIMGLTSLSTTIENVYSLGRLFSTIRLWTWETTVSTHDLTEPSLSPTKFRSPLFLNSLNRVERVLTSRRTVPFNLTRHLDHVFT